MSQIRLLLAILIAFILLIVTLVGLFRPPPITQAQGGPIAMTKVLNRATNVVRVGEVLTFTIALTNNSAFSLTNAGVLDTYDNTVLAFARAVPPPSVHLPATGIISWTNVATPPIPPMQGLTLTVVFTVEHPKPATINFAEARDLILNNSALSNSIASSRTQDAIGGAAPVFKFINPLTDVARVGFPLTFTHIITNDGAALLTFLPLTDTYDAAFLQFNFAIPTPTITSPAGTLVWNDLTQYFGPIPPFATVTITTVFTLTAQTNNTINQASTQGARDQYGNDLTPGMAQVPIIIIDDSAPTVPTKDTSADSDDDDDTVLIIPAATPTVIAVVVEQATLTSATPLFLPETGLGPPASRRLALVVGILMSIIVTLLLLHPSLRNRFSK